MSESSEQDRSEPPSTFKLKKARGEGSVARGMDLGFLGVTTCLVATTWFAGPRIVEAVQRGTSMGLAATDADLVGLPAFMELAAIAALPLVTALLPTVGATFAVVAALEFLQTGPVFSTRTLRFDFGRLNPASGFKRVFSLRMLIETGKGVLKLALYAAAAALVVRQAVSATASIDDAADLGRAMGRLASSLFVLAAGAAAVVALLDQIVARRDFLKKMRMSRRDVKREHKDREGDPRLKQRRKDLHGQFARTSQSLRGVRQADLIVVNPVHFAVALRYRPDLMDAPIVVSRGSHALALRLRRLAFIYGVPIMVDPSLARRLFQTTVLDRPIPDDLFRPVADAYLSVGRKPGKV
ncbi:EscU/YscU/HrcU family type III secretion system export apparatus switch protein [Brevundimonas sp.]|uniref:EscU/YscU/HrcU family type III secretion system export apparatus switch protein n=1 Tax=Brevundimonas sp. TaxID=1871086 RepID=UPI002E163D2F|nr:EscU/YscU/HrcU family type III secretion system export apparatus switch protein [Brevundimonas sp.]